MDQVTTERLSQISQAIHHVENAKREQQQILNAFWEHPPALDEEVVAKRMQEIRDRIRALEERRRALIQERDFLIVRAATIKRGGN